MHFPTVSKKAPTVSKEAKAVSKKARTVSKKAKIFNCQEASNCNQKSCILLMYYRHISSLSVEISCEKKENEVFQRPRRSVVLPSYFLPPP